MCVRCTLAHVAQRVSYKEAMSEFGFVGDLGYIQVKVRFCNIQLLRHRRVPTVPDTQATLMPYMADPQIQMNYNAAS